MPTRGSADAAGARPSGRSEDGAQFPGGAGPVHTLPSRAGPLYDQIYEILWERILSGEIVHGARVSDLEWSKRLNVSRTPVREAMRKLQQDGILTPLDRGGYELRRMDAEDFVSLYECRAALEGLAVRTAVRSLGEADIAGLAAELEESRRMVAEGRFERAFALHGRFHDVLISASRNPHLGRLLRDLRRMILFARASLMAAASDKGAGEDYRAHLQTVLADHAAILDAVRARDADAAAARMQAHLLETAADMARIAHEIAAR